MFSTAEKTTRHISVLQRNAVATAFLQRKADDSFLSPKQQDSFISPVSSATAFIQPKLEISQPDDPQEKEADEMAERVMNMPEPMAGTVSSSTEKEKIQPKSEEEEEEKVQSKYEGSVQRKCEKCEEEEKIQPKRFADDLAGKAAVSTITAGKLSSSNLSQLPKESIAGSSKFNLTYQDRAPPVSSATFEQTLYRTKGAGSALTGSLLNFLESRLDANLSDVRVHTGTTADQLNKGINAQAFTHGFDIFFKAGKFAPHTSSGFFLLVHELVHVLQQRGPRLKVTESSNFRKPFNNTLFEETRSKPSLFIPFKPSVEPITIKLNNSIAELEKSNQLKSFGAPERTEGGSSPSQGSGNKTDTDAAEVKEIPKAARTPHEDPAFQNAKKQVRREAGRQKRHKPTDQKREEAMKASALEKQKQEEQNSKERSTEEMETVGATQQREGRQFSAEKFKEDLIKRITNKQPESESEAKSFVQNPPLEHFEAEYSGNIAAEQIKVTGPLEQKAVPLPI